MLWEQYPPHYRFGSFIKKKRGFKETVNLRTGENITVLRNKPSIAPANIIPQRYNPRSAELITSKYLDAESFPEFYPAFTYLSLGSVFYSTPVETSPSSPSPPSSSKSNGVTSSAAAPPSLSTSAKTSSLPTSFATTPPSASSTNFKVS